VTNPGFAGFSREPDEPREKTSRQPPITARDGWIFDKVNGGSGRHGIVTNPFLSNRFRLCEGFRAE
jgi:hypothetical protein